MTGDSDHQRARLFAALQQTPIVRQWLKAFPQATGFSLELVTSDSQRSTRPVKGSFIVPIHTDGNAIAEFIVNRACPPKADKPRRGDSLIGRRAIKANKTLLALFARLVGELAPRWELAARDDDSPAVAKAKDYIRANVHRQLRLGEVAKASGYSVRHFCRLFSQATGTTFREHLIRVRIENSKALLCDKTKRVREVMDAVGFQSGSHFNRAFRKIVGTSPTQYRAWLRKSVAKADK